MFFVIFSLLFLFLASTAFFIGGVKGKRFVWQLSLAKIVLNVLSIVIAALLTFASAALTAFVIWKTIDVLDLLKSVNDLGIGIDVEGMIAVLGAALLSSILFLPIFAVTRGIMKLFLKLLTRLFLVSTGRQPIPRDELGEKPGKYDEFKSPRFNPIGALLGGISGLITLFVLFIPVVGTLNTVNDISYDALNASDHVAVKLTAEALDASANNLGAKTLKAFGGEVIFDKMTYSEAGEGTTTATVEEDFATVGQIVAAAVSYDVIDTLVDSPEDALANEECVSALLMPVLKNPRYAYLIDFGADFVIREMLISMSVPENTEDLYDEFLGEMDSVKGDDVEALTKAYSDVFDDYGLKVEKDVAVRAAEARMLGIGMKPWTRTNVVGNEQEFLSKTVRVSANDVTDGTAVITDAEREARALAHVCSTAIEFIDGMEDSDSDAEAVFEKIGPVLDALVATESIGPEKTRILLIGLLQSDMVHVDMGLSILDATDAANSMYENSLGGGYKPLTLSLSSTFGAVEAASDTSKDTTVAVKKMLDDLTPASSKVLQSIATPSVVMTYDVSEQSAEPVSNMLSDMFGNLSDAKEEGMSDEEYEKESVAVANMMDVLMTTDKSKSNTFGADSATGLTAEEYVNNIMDSKVMSGTLVDNVYADGENANYNPLNRGSGLNDGEKEDVLNAITSRWEASDKSAETEQKLVALAAVLNLAVERTDAGFVERVEATV